ncbi:hypothetical protein MANES_08G086300v8 [Manihot esculenta]|uniref:Uncharacterized protein n=2 Tax=Manihot esculenta TaxID=3983 RepID=A0A2C9VGI8_MANES|nr:hypothetical protein MANES_08G086300v8 [Manihot esculenta]
MGCFGKRRHKKKENKHQRPALATGGAYPANKGYRSGAGKGNDSGNKDGGMVIMTNIMAETAAAAAATVSSDSTCGGGGGGCGGGGGGGGCGGGGGGGC